MKVQRVFLWATVVVLTVLVSSCSEVAMSTRTQSKTKVCVPPSHVPGPPAHAPAHGRRRKMASENMVYDSDSKVYVVAGMDKHFWLDGQYYRFYDGHWELSVTIESGWEIIGDEKLPDGLRTKYKSKHLAKKNSGRGLALGKKKW